MQKYGFLVLFFLSLLIFSVEKAIAGPPFISDDPDSLDKSQGEFYLFSAYNKTTPDVFIGFPGLEVDYGLTDNLEFDTVAAYIFNYPHETNVPNASGFTDTQLELKYRLVQETDHLPQVAFAPIYYYPPGNYNRDLGNGRPWLQLPFWIQKSWGDWTTYGGGGYAINSAPLTRNFVYGGWVLQKNINDKWMLGGEYYASGSVAPGVRSYSLVDLGGGYALTKNLNLLFSVGHNINGQQVVYSYLGLRLDF